MLICSDSRPAHKDAVRPRQPGRGTAVLFLFSEVFMKYLTKRAPAAALLLSLALILSACGKQAAPDAEDSVISSAVTDAQRYLGGSGYININTVPLIIPRIRSVMIIFLFTVHQYFKPAWPKYMIFIINAPFFNVQKKPPTRLQSCPPLTIFSF